MRVFIQDYYLIFMIVLLSLSILIMLRTVTVTFIQLLFFGVMLWVSQMDIIWLISLLFTVQLVFTLYLMYRLKKAIDYNFQLVLEKTHLIDRYFTKTDYSGSKKSFFF